MKKERNNKNKTSIGGQAVMEGVMMRGESAMATAVRDSDGVIRVEAKRIKSSKKRCLFFRLPIIRGVYSFIQTMISGIQVLLRSSEVYGEAEPSRFEKWLAKKLKIDIMSVVTTLSLVIALALSVFLFIFLPQEIRGFFVKWFNISTEASYYVWIKNLLEGLIKIAIFISYILLCSLIKDVRRTFMYHGAEHKTISCYEKGLELTVENAKKCTRVHDRCGTTFIFFVMVISIIAFAVFESLIPNELSRFLRILCKILILPFVAGLSYELLKGLAKTNLFIFYPLKLPGLLLQRITTKEPDDKMLEVAITAFNKAYQMDNDQEAEECTFKMPKTVKDVTEQTISILKSNGIDETAEAEWIVSLTLGIKRDDVYSDLVVSVLNQTKIEALLNQRILGRPLWYCIGDTEFYGYKIKVNENVLIPRPETELLVYNAIKEISSDMTVLDLCTGSGAIAIAVNKTTNATVYAVDVSAKALDVAKENAELNSVEINFVLSDLFTEIKDLKFDVIISNPPYIKTDEISTLQSEVRDYEPMLALDGGMDGLDFCRKICSQAKYYLKENGILFLECGFNQAKDVSELLSNDFNVEIIKDYENIERIVKAVRRV